MLQVRKLVLAVAAATAFSSSLTYALGLGDLSVKSSLNQPLDAEISLLEVRDLTSVEIKSQLASPEDFSKAGVGREYFLTDLKFTPVLNDKGKSVIRVTSGKPVKEPYLNFVVEILWPNGRLLREYTILLDPPLYIPQQVVYAPQPATITSPSRPAASVQQPVPRPQATAPVQAARSQTTARSTNALQGSDYRVQKNDTLWDIAARVGGGTAVHQTMLAIQDLNPDAFIDGNINRMKSGQVLRLPTEQQINSRSRAEAIAQVAKQNSSWKTGSETKTAAERQLDATHRSQAGAAPAKVEKADSLRLVADAPGQAQQAADQGNASNNQVLKDQLAVTKERLDSSALENEDLKGHVEDLSSKLEKLERLIALKDNQLAQLQNAVEEPVEVTVAPVAAAEDTDVSATAVESISNSEQPVADEVETVLADPEPASETVAELEPSEPQAIIEPEPAVEPVPDTPAEASVSAAQPVEEEQGLLEKVAGDPMLLAAVGGGAILALLLLLMAVSRRNARKEAEFFERQDAQVVPNDDAPLAVVDNQESSDTEFLSDSDLENVAQEVNEAPFADDFDFDFDTSVAESQFKEQATDPIAEANSYISFGRFNQAAEVLNNAVDQEPQRVDLRLKLAEVYADLEDRDGFSRQIQDIKEIGGASSEIAQFKARYPKMFDVEQVENIADSNDFDEFNLDDLTIDMPAEVAEKGLNITAELDDLAALLAETESDIRTTGGEFSLDADLDLETDSHAAFSAKPAVVNEGLESVALDDFNFDLDTLLTDEKPVITEKDDFADLSLSDLELDLPETQSLATNDFELDDDFSLAIAEPDNQLDSDFGMQLDEVNAELDSLTLNLSDDVLALNTKNQEPLIEDPVSPTEQPVTGFEDLQDLDGLDDDFGILAGTDETATKLDLARAYVDMGDAEGARDILDEVIAEGNPAQQEQARELIAELG